MDKQHTSGPWTFEAFNEVIAGDPSLEGMILGGDGMTIVAQCVAERDVPLLTAAPDHADIGWAMCVGPGRWEPWGDMRGEFVMNGIRHATKLDAFGVPEVTPAMRSAIAKARTGLSS